MGQYHGDIGVILPVRILVAHPAVQIHMEGKRQLPILKGGKPLPKYTSPHIKTSVLADKPPAVEQLKVFLLNAKSGVNADGLPFFIKILFTDLITAAHRTYRVQHRCFSCIVFPNQNQRPVNAADFQVTDGFEVAYV